ncbi:hypothetical protein [Gimesia sp.]|uniref:hypothetical protein n=1 Tax=Gimesia sp. TaxID=2024833 RepID=UPI003A916DAD
MVQKDCGLSLIKKPCPRKRFPCSRCGAKIVNSGLQWEISIPKFKRWHFMDAALSQNGAASFSPVVVNLPNRMTHVDPETQDSSPCKFGGPAFYEFTGLFESGESPASHGTWVQDFEWNRYDDVADQWMQFGRSHGVSVEWEQAEVKVVSGDLIKPGRWRINLTISQQAILRQDSEVVGVDPIFANAAVGTHVNGGIGGPFSSSNPGDTDINDYSIIQHTYYQPDGYQCLDAGRWTRPVPTLPVLSNTPHTIETLPEEYQWPDDVNPYLTDGFEVFDVPVTYNGPFYPVGFAQTNDIYYAPPYIDVRYTKK